MTDLDARHDLERAVKWGIFGSPPSVETMRHALRAIEDRAELCDAIYAYNAGGAEHANRLRDSCKRRMSGQE